MQVAKYQHEQETHTASNMRLCAPCNPIIFQVFCSDFEDGRLMDFGDYEPVYFDFDFVDNEYGKFIAGIKEDNEYDELMNDIDTATIIETRDLPEIEKELTSLIAPQAERTYETSYIYNHCKDGYKYFHSGEYAMAIEKFETALALNNRFEGVKFPLAMAYYFIGDYHNARRIVDGYQHRRYLNDWGADPAIAVEQFYKLLELKMAS